jgi:hypothetical protein
MERPRVLARLSGRKNHCVRISFVLYRRTSLLAPKTARPFSINQVRGQAAPKPTPRILVER